MSILRLAVVPKTHSKSVEQKSAWFMLHRIRESMDPALDLLTGEVEVDEAWIGGLEEKGTARHGSTKVGTHRSTSTKEAPPHVIPLKRRKWAQLSES